MNRDDLLRKRAARFHFGGDEYFQGGYIAGAKSRDKEIKELVNRSVHWELCCQGKATQLKELLKPQSKIEAEHIFLLGLIKEKNREIDELTEKITALGLTTQSLDN